MNPYKEYSKPKKRKSFVRLQTYTFLAGENKETNKITKEKIKQTRKTFGRKTVKL